MAFDGDISKWDVSRVTNMRDMFAGTRAFNVDISKWNVGSVTTMQGMFYAAKAFNRDISKWDVSRVTNMEWTFNSASSYSQILCGAWAVATANKDGMFGNTKGGKLCGSFADVSKYVKVFDGECMDGSEIKIFEGADNPGKTPEGRVAECSKACISKNWTGFGRTQVAKGFVVALAGEKKQIGRCFCESSDAVTCKRLPAANHSYGRFDWSSSGQ